jgi:alditol oxidase
MLGRKAVIHRSGCDVAEVISCASLRHVLENNFRFDTLLLPLWGIYYIAKLPGEFGNLACVNCSVITCQLPETAVSFPRDNKATMDKREFLRTSGVFLAGAMLSPLGSGEQPGAQRTNWSGNYTYSTDRLHQPKTVEEVRQVVKRCSKVRVLGSRHSFNGIADSTENQISLAHLNQIALNRESSTVSVGGGVTYSQLAPYLEGQGYALHNLASLPQITVAGAIATATHGSGNKNGNLATAVSGLELVTANGEVLVLSRDRDPDRFPGAAVNLGALGVVTKVTLDVQPTFQVAQVVYENLGMDQLERHLDEIFTGGYSVSLFTDWQNHRIGQVWVKRRVQPGSKPQFDPQLFGAKLATTKLHPLPGHSAESCTEQLGIPGPWYERLPHFRINFTPSSGAELQSEYLIPREKGYQAILAVEQLRDQVTPHLFISELRTVAADQLWMSTAYQRPTMAIHFTWKPEWPAVKNVLPMIEEKLAPFDARPHWGKLFAMSASRIKPLYPEMSKYQGLLAHYDPQGKFRNRFMETDIYGA